MNKPLQEGMKVYYIVDHHVYSGNVIHIERTETGEQFSIDSYGGCEGNFRIDSSMLNVSVFLDEETAQTLANDMTYTGGFQGYC